MLKKIIALLLVCCLSIISTTNIYAKEELDGSIKKCIDSFNVDYTLTHDGVVESTFFTDTDGTKVNMIRTVHQDGTGKLETIRAGQLSESIVLKNQDYNFFFQFAKSCKKNFILEYRFSNGAMLRSGTIGSNITGAQYKKTLISKQTLTLDNSALAQAKINGIATIVGYIIGRFNTPAGLAATIGGYLLSTIMSFGASKIVMTQFFYEVKFKADNAYYTHLYRYLVKDYNAQGVLIDTTNYYFSAVGG
ncbi:hypothetical protein [Lachnoanaerobaculum orale]|uniref:hypothetical protein n=1 Tax=Lachnoanaerobaculum orale TaxID=979627 RepID=UPI0023A90E6C|nr:hypothetical protein [Lachnoanaerobaculum orale]